VSELESVRKTDCCVSWILLMPKGRKGGGILDIRIEAQGRE